MICKKCGCRVSDSAAFCDKCGASMAEFGQKEVSAPQKAKSPEEKKKEDNYNSPDCFRRTGRPFRSEKDCGCK